MGQLEELNSDIKELSNKVDAILNALGLVLCKGRVGVYGECEKYIKKEHVIVVDVFCDDVLYEKDSKFCKDCFASYKEYHRYNSRKYTYVEKW